MGSTLAEPQSPDSHAHTHSIPASADADTEAALDVAVYAARERADYVLGILNHLSNRHRLQILTVLYNAPSGLGLHHLASTLDRPEEQVQSLLDRLVKASLVSVLPVLDDQDLGWVTRYLVTPAAREWLERVALANGREAVVPT